MPQVSTRTATKKTNHKQDMSTRYTVFRKDYPDGKGGSYSLYRLSVGKKREDGSYDNAYIKARFTKASNEEMPMDMDRIEIQSMDIGVNAWDKDGERYTEPIVWVKKFTYVG